MNLSTYEKGDTINVPVTFTDPTTGAEVSGVTDAMISIFFGGTSILAPTAMTLESGGRFFYSYTIPLTASSGVYSVYVTGTVLGTPQTATLNFSVTDRLTELKDTTDAIKLDIQGNQIDLENRLTDLQTDIGNPSIDGTTLHQQMQEIKGDLGEPLTTGQDITQKLDDIRTILGLGTPVGVVEVEGEVLDDNSNPIGGVRVVAVDTTTGLAVDVAQTSSLGVYVLHVNPGGYILQFLQQQTVLKQTLNITVPTMITELTVPSVTLATKRTVTDVIQDPSGNPIEGVLVKAIFETNFDADAAQNQVEAAAFSNVSGEYTLELFPGCYIFEFVKTGFSTLPEKKTVF